jgi:putative Holliday junction resolvase
MNILAIDFGEKNIGLAFADSETKLPLSLKPLRVGSEEEALEKLGEIIKEKNIAKIVFGLPLSFEFAETEQSEKVHQFADKLTEKYQIEQAFLNEVLSSAMAARLQKTSKNTHSSSALIILEDYLNRYDEHGR